MSQDIGSISAGQGYGIDYEVVGQESQTIGAVEQRWIESMKTLEDKINFVKQYYIARGSDAITAEVDDYWPTLVRMQQTMDAYSVFLTKAGTMSVNTDEGIASSVKNTLNGGR